MTDETRALFERLRELQAKTVARSEERTDNVAMAVNNYSKEAPAMARTKTRTKATTSKSAPKTKRCSRCSKTRKVEQFYKDRHMKDGYSSWCKSCTRDYDRDYAKRKRAEATA
jgi:hypothetical protein